jgi:hypothetical protein
MELRKNCDSPYGKCVARHLADGKHDFGTQRMRRSKGDDYSQRGSFGVKATVETDYYLVLFGDECVVLDGQDDAWKPLMIRVTSRKFTTVSKD